MIKTCEGYKSPLIEPQIKLTVELFSSSPIVTATEPDVLIPRTGCLRNDVLRPFLCEIW